MRRGGLQLIAQLNCFKFGYTNLIPRAGQSARLSEEVEVHLAILVMAWHSLANRDLLLDQQRPQHSLRSQKLFWKYWRIGCSWKWQVHIKGVIVQTCKQTFVCFCTNVLRLDLCTDWLSYLSSWPSFLSSSSSWPRWRGLTRGSWGERNVVTGPSGNGWAHLWPAQPQTMECANGRVSTFTYAAQNILLVFWGLIEKRQEHETWDILKISLNNRILNWHNTQNKPRCLICVAFWW